jgi:hypothetical protein
MRRFVVILASALPLACGEAEEPTALEPGGVAELERITGAPEVRAPAPRAGIELSAGGTRLAPLGGVVAVGTSDGLYATQLGDDVLDRMSVHPDQAGPGSTGAVRWLAPRADDGLLVVADSGLFHAASGYLLSSPFGASVDASEIVSLSSFGSGSEEELWLTTTAAAYWVSGGTVTEYSLRSAPGPISFAIGTGPGKAVAAAGQSAFFIDLAARRAEQLASGLGTIAGGAAEEDGSVHLATSEGVLSRDRSGRLSLRTLAESGVAALEVRAIAGAFGSVLALTDSGLVSIEAGAAGFIGEEAPTGSGSVALDASGDAWTIEDGGLFRYRTGTPVSFGDDVAPFMQAHCASCHAAGATSAPDHDFTDFETAKHWADTIARRLQATDGTSMPPPNAEVLTSADYAVVLRWIKSGLLP